MPQYRIDFFLKKAEGLLGLNPGNTSNPSVILSVASNGAVTERRSQVVQKTTNPDFGNEHLFIEGLSLPLIVTLKVNNNLPYTDDDVLDIIGVSTMTVMAKSKVNTSYEEEPEEAEEGDAMLVAASALEKYQAKMADANYVLNRYFPSQKTLSLTHGGVASLLSRGQKTGNKFGSLHISYVVSEMPEGGTAAEGAAEGGDTANKKTPVPDESRDNDLFVGGAGAAAEDVPEFLSSNSNAMNLAGVTNPGAFTHAANLQVQGSGSRSTSNPQLLRSSGGAGASASQLTPPSLMLQPPAVTVGAVHTVNNYSVPATRSPPNAESTALKNSSFSNIITSQTPNNLIAQPPVVTPALLATNSANSANNNNNNNANVSGANSLGSAPNAGGVGVGGGLLLRPATNAINNDVLSSAPLAPPSLLAPSGSRSNSPSQQPLSAGAGAAPVVINPQFPPGHTVRYEVGDRAALQPPPADGQKFLFNMNSAGPNAEVMYFANNDATGRVTPPENTNNANNNTSNTISNIVVSPPPPILYANSSASTLHHSHHSLTQQPQQQTPPQNVFIGSANSGTIIPPQRSMTPPNAQPQSQPQSQGAAGSTSLLLANNYTEPASKSLPNASFNSNAGGGGAAGGLVLNNAVSLLNPVLPAVASTLPAPPQGSASSYPALLAYSTSSTPPSAGQALPRPAGAAPSTNLSLASLPLVATAPRPQPLSSSTSTSRPTTPASQPQATPVVNLTNFTLGAPIPSPPPFQQQQQQQQQPLQPQPSGATTVSVRVPATAGGPGVATTASASGARPAAASAGVRPAAAAATGKPAAGQAAREVEFSSTLAAIYSDADYLLSCAARGDNSSGIFTKIKDEDPLLSKGLLGIVDYSGRTVLHLLCFYGHLDLLKLLLSPVQSGGAGAWAYPCKDLRAVVTLPGRSTLLHCAASGGQAAVVNYLLRVHPFAGPLLLPCLDSHSRTAAERAIAAGFPDLARQLIS